MTREYTDAERMDWLERDGFQLLYDGDRPGVECASDGRSFFADTLREAVDRAMAFENYPDRVREVSDDDGASLL